MIINVANWQPKLAIWLLDWDKWIQSKHSRHSNNFKTNTITPWYAHVRVHHAGVFVINFDYIQRIIFNHFY